jgi:hypothetical protein
MSAPHPEDERGRVLPFRRREKPRAEKPDVDKPGADKSSVLGPAQPPIEGLEKYSADREPDDYRQRMTNNVLALAFCLLLMAIGIWLANSIADLRRKQDCVLSGRRDCANISVPPAGPR